LGEQMNKYEKYLQERMDPISKSFCAAKWYNATLWLGHGQTVSCHHPEAHDIPLDEIKLNPAALHNTSIKKQARKEMLSGIRPPECKYCWKFEDNNQQSDRIFKTIIYSDDDIADIAHASPDDDVVPRTLEISFNRACNLACSYCNPAFSTTWVNDIHENGPYKNITTDSYKQYESDASWANNVTKHEKDNPYIDAFWKWWDTGLSDGLEQLRITGGEPFMHTSTWRILDWFKDNPESEMTLAVNTNLLLKPAKFEQLIEQSKNIKHLEIYTSNESYGDASNYIRSGMNYDEWLKNTYTLLEHGNVERLHVMMTVGALCLPTMVEFLEDMLVMRKKYGDKGPMLSLNMVHSPEFQGITSLSQQLREEYADNIEEWVTWKHASLLSHEIPQFKRLCASLRVVTDDAVTRPLADDFKQFIMQFDKRRGTSFSDTFPANMTEWYFNG
jgi:organic radical activating enzyme